MIGQYKSEQNIDQHLGMKASLGVLGQSLFQPMMSGLVNFLMKPMDQYLIHLEKADSALAEGKKNWE